MRINTCNEKKWEKWTKGQLTALISKHGHADVVNGTHKIFDLIVIEFDAHPLGIMKTKGVSMCFINNNNI